LVLVTGGIWKDKAGVFCGTSSGGLQLIMSLLGREVVARVRPSEVRARR
jgi:hypothetical protein